MDDENSAAGFTNGLDKMMKVLIVVLIIEADAGFDGHRNLDFSLHGGNTFGDQGRFSDEASADATRLNAIAGTTHIQIDLLVTGIFHHAGAGCQIRIRSLLLTHEFLI